MFLRSKLNRWIDNIRSQVILPLRLELWDGETIDFSQDHPSVTIRLQHASALSYLLVPSLSNLGTAYVEGKIEIEGKAAEIIAIINTLAKNSIEPVGKYARAIRTFLHNKESDAEAIQYHYDVSNDFYRHWLDENMVYSCAYFEHGNEDLGTAQLKKIDHVLTKIQVRPNDRLLDIGCGWGALVLRAAEKFGARCVGVTLSKNQYALAKARVERAGLTGRIDIRLQDYRDVIGTFDRITSVGMFEHVGLMNLATYFTKIHSLLAKNGVAMNHGITSSDAGGREAPYGGGRFIEKYVFPKGELAHIGLVLKAMQEGGMEAVDIENLRHHYVKTCNKWLENFESKKAEIIRLTDEKKFRIWRVYLAGSAYAFTQDWISIYQVVCTRAGRNDTTLPMSRGYMYSEHR